MVYFIKSEVSVITIDFVMTSPNTMHYFLKLPLTSADKIFPLKATNSRPIKTKLIMTLIQNAYQLHMKPADFISTVPSCNTPLVKFQTAYFIEKRVASWLNQSVWFHKWLGPNLHFTLVKIVFSRDYLLKCEVMTNLW